MMNGMVQCRVPIREGKRLQLARRLRSHDHWLAVVELTGAARVQDCKLVQKWSHEAVNTCRADEQHRAELVSAAPKKLQDKMGECYKLLHSERTPDAINIVQIHTRERTGALAYSVLPVAARDKEEEGHQSTPASQ